MDDHATAGALFFAFLAISLTALLFWDRIGRALWHDIETIFVGVKRGGSKRYVQLRDAVRTAARRHGWQPPTPPSSPKRTPVAGRPVPVNERRLASIQQVWQAAWPEGSWAIATVPQLRSGHCLVSHEEWEQL
ncbi:hypothetical protein [Candidatus Viridilinea mediisalina]|uniref:Uncharacterized protein n=1 Tax=Candidatus Viridilinea mediisalina TaxID=2024553 RepID=A0A2A6RI84_9CHLR|nr:hypothetical protein [Candidatus Viridilinea mediisalina]PDW02606.1 hypothetical protein CJ255_13035 [Candidatus Viridilinea mediisalina]